MARLAVQAGDGSTGRRRRFRGWSLVLAALVLALPLSAGAIEELRFFRIGTAATTGTYFQIGGVLASAISKAPGSRDCARGGSCGVAGLIAVAQATQGSIQNVLAVGSGQFESAFAQSDVAYWAYSGASPASKRCGKGKTEPAGNAAVSPLAGHAPIKNLRVIAGLFPEDVHIVVRDDSSIRTLRDLKSKRVALGEPESGTLPDARLVLEAGGLSECDIKPSYLRLSEAAESLAQGRIDAFFLVGGYPLPAIAELASTVPTRLVPIPRQIAERLTEKYAFFAVDTIPAGTYPGIDTETATLSTRALWLVRAEADEKLIYAITKALWSDATKRLLEATHPVGKRIRLTSALDGIAIPLHPGALRFYRDSGIPIPDGL
jgi:uncharacterized protein